jgi:hypothetical protein
VSDRVYLPDAGGVFGQKIDDGGHDTNLVYFDGRTVATPDHVKAARNKWPEANARDFTALDNGVYLDKATTALYRRAQGQPLLAEHSNVSTFFLLDDSDGGQIVFLEKAGGTLKELQQQTAQAEADQAQAESNAAEQRRKQLDRAPRRTVTLADLEASDLPSLQQAARTIIEEHRGTIRAKDGKILIEVPEMLTEPGAWNAGFSEAAERRRVHDAARVLIAARDVVIGELDRRGRLDVERLPDVQVGADGTIA